MSDQTKGLKPQEVFLFDEISPFLEKLLCKVLSRTGGLADFKKYHKGTLKEMRTPLRAIIEVTPDSDVCIDSKKLKELATEEAQLTLA